VTGDARGAHYLPPPDRRAAAGVALSAGSKIAVARARLRAMPTLIVLTLNVRQR
jgi:hypothetical protein